MNIRDAIYNKARIKFIKYYNTCPLCKWPTNSCRITEWNRECIACNNQAWYWYSFQPRASSELNILKSVMYEEELDSIINNNLIMETKRYLPIDWKLIYTSIFKWKWFNLVSKKEKWQIVTHWYIWEEKVDFKSDKEFLNYIDNLTIV